MWLGSKHYLSVFLVVGESARCSHTCGAHLWDRGQPTGAATNARSSGAHTPAVLALGLAKLQGQGATNGCQRVLEDDNMDPIWSSNGGGGRAVTTDFLQKKCRKI